MELEVDKRRLAELTAVTEKRRQEREEKFQKGKKEKGKKKEGPSVSEKYKQMVRNLKIYYNISRMNTKSSLKSYLKD